MQRLLTQLCNLLLLRFDKGVCHSSNPVVYAGLRRRGTSLVLSQLQGGALTVFGANKFS